MDWDRLSVNEIRNKLLTRREAVTREALETLSNDPRAGARSVASALLLRRARGRRATDVLLGRRETELRHAGYRAIAGVDEVGVGPWAGPVVAAAVVFASDPEISGVDDSKLLQRDRREALEPAIRAAAADVSLGVVEAGEVDSIGNILAASRLAMTRAIRGLKTAPDIALVDGRPCGHEIPCRHEEIVKGDRRVFAIAAASIVAKVWRDRTMTELDAVHPGYGFARHKGYGTAEHFRALREKGPSPIHRRSFAPVREAAGGFVPDYYAAVERILASDGLTELDELYSIFGRHAGFGPIERKRLLLHVRMRRNELRGAS